MGPSAEKHTEKYKERNRALYRLQINQRRPGGHEGIAVSPYIFCKPTDDKLLKNSMRCTVSFYFQGEQNRKCALFLDKAPCLRYDANISRDRYEVISTRDIAKDEIITLVVGQVMHLSRRGKYIMDQWPIFDNERDLFVRTEPVIYDCGYLFTFRFQHSVHKFKAPLPDFGIAFNLSRFISFRPPNHEDVNACLRCDPFGHRFEICAAKDIPAGTVICLPYMFLFRHCYVPWFHYPVNKDDHYASIPRVHKHWNVLINHLPGRGPFLANGSLRHASLAGNKALLSSKALLSFAIADAEVDEVVDDDGNDDSDVDSVVVELGVEDNLK